MGLSTDYAKDYAKIKNYFVIKRNGFVLPLEVGKIEGALRHVLSQELTEEITRQVCNKLYQISECEETAEIPVEDIQDCIEETLMQQGFYPEARSYISHRNEHKKERDREEERKEERERTEERDKKTKEEINAVNSTLGYFPTPIQAFQFYDKYSRWDEGKGRRETWPETVSRTITFLKAKTDSDGTKLGAQTWIDLEEAILKMEIMPSMRVLQMAGPALERCNVGAYNCAYLPIDTLSAFSELLYILMQGTGCGFSVESQYVSELPVISPSLSLSSSLVSGNKNYLVEDSTEGWVNALTACINYAFNGMTTTFDFSLIRPAGAVLKTKGGRASGPEPLASLLSFVEAKIRGKAGSKLSTQDCHDICCFIGQIVQVGGVRRAAEISLSDLSDTSIRDCKTGQFWNEHPERMMANNSAVYTSTPSSLTFLTEWHSLASSGSGERGIFNRESILTNLPKRRSKEHKFGINPCGEIILRPRQFCNLTMAVARPSDSQEDLKRKVYLASVLGTIQSALTSFSPMLPAKWKMNCEDERLLGVDITGQQDCPLFTSFNFPGLRTQTLLCDLKRIAMNANIQTAQKLKINPSTSVTCVKPSGNSSQFLNCSSGLHPRFAPFYIRRVRVGAYTPIAKVLIKAGVPYHPETGQSLPTASVLVFDFPIMSPKEAITRKNMSAVDQLEYWRDLKLYYTEHNPSCTISIREGEWIEVGNWVYKNFSLIGGLSFLPYSDHNYPLAPYEEVTEREYLNLMTTFPKNIPWGDLVTLEREDNTTSSQEFACTSGACEL